ncbi:MAG: type VI secretion system baseplate subunit TssK, partial [Planctomycetaceae bacterium]
MRLTIDSFVPYNWGFARLDIDTEALSAGRLSVTSVLARFPSGTLVETPEMAVLKPLAIRPLIGSSGEVNVYLAVPDMSNFSEISDAKRFEFHEMMIPDEHDGA